MKKTTFVIIAVVGLLFAAAFAFPPLAFESVDMKLLILKPSGDSATISTGMFVTLKVKAPFRGEFLGDVAAPYEIAVSENPDISIPQLTMNSTWNDNLSIDCRNDSLIVSVDFHSVPRNEEGGMNLEIDPALQKLFFLEVPAGMLRTIATDTALELYDFSNATLDIAKADQLKMTNCSFKSLSE